MTWVGGQNIVLSVFTHTNDVTVEQVKCSTRVLCDADLKKMLWDKKFDLQDFLTVTSRNAPCINNPDNTGDFDFWPHTMSSNVVCERYIGRVKSSFDNGQINDDENVDDRLKAVINLHDVRKMNIK